jgi:hypothetical protein
LFKILSNTLSEAPSVVFSIENVFICFTARHSVVQNFWLVEILSAMVYNTAFVVAISQPPKYLTNQLNHQTKLSAKNSVKESAPGSLQFFINCLCILFHNLESSSGLPTILPWIAAPITSAESSSRNTFLFVLLRSTKYFSLCLDIAGTNSAILHSTFTHFCNTDVETSEITFVLTLGLSDSSTLCHNS